MIGSDDILAALACREQPADALCLDSAYSRLINERLAELPNGPSLLAAARAARGLFPVDVAGWFRTHRCHSFVQPDEAVLEPPARYKPELHMLDGEWYFTEETSKYLAALLDPEASLLLGVPTVANQLAAPTSVLVDRSPFVRDRFPGLTTAWLREDVSVVQPDGVFRTVLLDPPWNMAELYSWIQLASHAVGHDGTLFLPLLGECTRPEAADQRFTLLQHLRAAGEVDVFPDIIEYEIPLFEYRTLLSAGAPLAGPWRRADLVTVRLKRPVPVPPQTHAPDPLAGDWEPFRLGGQVVKLRRQTWSLTSGPFITPPPMTGGYTLQHISRRMFDPSQIGLWTSRNVVARVLDYATVRDLLEELQGDETGLAARGDGIRSRAGARANELLRLLEI